MILNLDENIGIESADIVAVVNLAGEDSSPARGVLREARAQKRILAGNPAKARSMILCAGARRPGGVTENARLYLSPVASDRVARRAQGSLKRWIKP